MASTAGIVRINGNCNFLLYTDSLHPLSLQSMNGHYVMTTRVENPRRSVMDERTKRQTHERAPPRYKEDPRIEELRAELEETRYGANWNASEYRKLKQEFRALQEYCTEQQNELDQEKCITESLHEQLEGAHTELNDERNFITRLAKELKDACKEVQLNRSELLERQDELDELNQSYKETAKAME